MEEYFPQIENDYLGGISSGKTRRNEELLHG